MVKAGDRVRTNQTYRAHGGVEVFVTVMRGSEGTVVDDHEGSAQVEFDALKSVAVILPLSVLEVI
jgi:hypothetical protein